MVPHSSFRSQRPSEFHPGLVKLLDGDVREILALTEQHLASANEEIGVRNERVRALKLDEPQLSRLLRASSGTVREWALRTMGERSVGPFPKTELVSLATNASERLFVRALAVRVLGREALDGATAETLLGLLDTCEDIDFQRIVLETLASGARETPALDERLSAHLSSPEVAVQFETFNTLRRVASSNNITRFPDDYARAKRLSELTKESGVEAAKTGLLVLRETNAPAYLRCAALQALAYQTNQPGAVEALLAAIEDENNFVSHLAGNVLGSLPAMDGKGIAALADGAGSTNAAVRWHALLKLNARGQNMHGTEDAVVSALKRIAREGASAREIGLCLELARKLGVKIAPAAGALIDMLSENSPAYRDLSKHEVDRARGMVFVALAAIGTPTDALEAIVSALANGDESSTHEFAGAARAAAALGPRGRAAIPHLARALDNDETSWSDWISLETFDAHTNPSAAYTTPQVEALRALAVLGVNDARAIRAIRAFAKGAPRDFNGVDVGVSIPNAHGEALKALYAINTQGRRAAQLQVRSVRRVAGE